MTSDSSSNTITLNKFFELNDEDRIAEGKTTAILNAFKELLEDFKIDDTEKLESIKTCFNIIAELSKQEEFRIIYRENAIVELVLKSFIKLTKVNFNENILLINTIVESLRALGNLCYDDDENREIIFNYEDGIFSLISLIEDNNSTVSRTVCGALINICMDSELIQNKILELKSLSLLLPYLDTNEVLNKNLPFNNLYVIVRLISNLIESEEGIKQILSGNGLNILMSVIKHRHVTLLNPFSDESFDEDLEILEPLVASLESIFEKEDIQRKTLEGGFIDILFDFVDHRPSHKLDEDQLKSYEDIRKTVTRMIALVTMHDVNMKQMTSDEHIINRFKEWVLTGYNNNLIVQEDQIRVAGCICLGNLARSDETCEFLVNKHHIELNLIEIIKKEEERIDPKLPEMKGIIKVLHAATGALKNISLTPKNKPILAKTDILDTIVNLMPYPGLRPIQFNCIGIIKNLLVGDNCEYSIYKVITGSVPTSHPIDLSIEKSKYNKNSPLKQIVHLINNSTDESEAGIRNEGARLISNLIKFLHKNKLTNLLKTVLRFDTIPTLIQVITGYIISNENDNYLNNDNDRASIKSSNDTLNEELHVKFKLGSIEGPVYPIVQMDGILSLVLIIDNVPEYINQILLFKTNLELALTKIINSNTNDTNSDISKSLEYNDQIKSNARILLSKIQSC